jgi:hypothetical protein
MPKVKLSNKIIMRILLILWLIPIYCFAQNIEDINPGLHFQQSFQEKVNYVGVLTGKDNEIVCISKSRVVINRATDFREVTSYVAKIPSLGNISTSNSRYVAYLSGGKIYLKLIRTGKSVDIITCSSKQVAFSSDEETMLIIRKNIVRFYDVQTHNIRPDSLVLPEKIQAICGLKGTDFFACLTGSDPDFGMKNLIIFRTDGKILTNIKNRFSCLGTSNISGDFYVVKNDDEIYIMSMERKQSDTLSLSIKNEFHSKFPIESIIALDTAVHYMVCNVRPISSETLFKQAEKDHYRNKASSLFERYVNPTTNCVIDLSNNTIVDTIRGHVSQFQFLPESNSVVYSFLKENPKMKIEYGMERYDIETKKVTSFKPVAATKIRLISETTKKKWLATVDENWNIHFFSQNNADLYCFKILKDTITLPPRAKVRIFLSDMPLTNDSLIEYNKLLSNCSLAFTKDQKYLVFQSPKSLQIFYTDHPAPFVVKSIANPISFFSLKNNHCYFFVRNQWWDYDFVKDSLQLNRDTTFLKEQIYQQTMNKLNRKNLFSLTSSGQVTLIDTIHNIELARLTLFSKPFEYLINTPDGYFDCANSLVKWMYWKDSNSDNFYRFEALYNDFFTPHLLYQLLNNGIKRNILPLQFYTKLPDILYLIQNGEIIPKKNENRYYLCFSNIDNFSTQVLRQQNFPIIFNDKNIDCNNSIEIPKKIYYYLTEQNLSLQDSTKRTIYNYVKTNSKLIILSIGVDHYPSYSNLDSLTNSNKALIKFNDIFSKNQNLIKNAFDSLLILKPLIDQTATLDSIENKINWVIDHSNENDCLVLYFIGHGQSSKSSEFFHFFPYDGIDGSEDEICNSTLNTAYLADIFKALRNRRIILIIDACESAGAAPPISKIAECLTNIKDSSSIKQCPYSINAIFSSLSYQRSQQSNYGSLLVNIIENSFNELQKQSGNITVDDLIFEMEKQAKVYKGRMKQTPVIINVGNNFYLFKQN